MSKYMTPVLVLAVAVLAVSLFIKGGEVITAYDVASTNTSEATLNISDIDPTMENVKCYDYNTAELGNMGSNPLALKGGTTALVICNGTANDENGGEYINSTSGGASWNIEGRIYETSQGSACAADSTNCYTNLTKNCEVIGVKNATANYYECSFQVYYHADNTSQSGSWTGWMEITDDDAGSGSATATWDMDELLAVGVPGELAFGTARPGDTLAVNKSHTVTNYGNVEMDLQLNGSNPGMTCDSVANIPTGNIKFNCTSTQGTDYGAGTPLTTSASSTNCTGFDLAESSSTASPPVVSTDDTYWGVNVPEGVSGNCQGTIWFTAIASI